MSFGLSKENLLYHGTSSKRAKSIRKNGFQIPPHKEDRWLGSNGVYFVSNRPSIAYRFACKATLVDRSSEVILKVSFNLQDNDTILDLTSDSGLNILFCCYLRLYRAFNQRQDKNNARTPDVYKPDEYESDLEHKIKEFEKNAEQVLSLYLNKSGNWDSAALRLAAMEKNMGIIAAAIQEGDSFSLSILNSPFKDSYSNYSGIRYRDHIEICFIDQLLLQRCSVSTININEHFDHMHEAFSSRMKDSLSRDAR